MKSIVVIPTYNERENIAKLVEDILRLKRDIHILIVDDNSPDGTGEIADELSSKHKEVEVIHRKGKLGLGTAYIEGFKYALKNGVDYILEMDADFSHNPKRLPVFLNAIQKYDLVLGSRYLNGVSVINWGFGRLLLSKMATRYVKIITGLPVTDATGGFKCFRREVLEAIDLGKVRSNGYSFQIEMTYKAYRKGFRIGEIPIIFEDRRVGKSKMSKKIVIEALFIVWKLQLGYLAKKTNMALRRLIGKVFSSQFVKFCIVGGVGFIINIGIFYIANKIFSIHYISTAILSFLAAVSNNFVLNRIWTFRDYEKKGILSKYFKYILTNVAGLSVNLLALASLIRIFNMQPLVSQAIAVIIGTGFNFLGSKIFVFDLCRVEE